MSENTKEAYKERTQAQIKEWEGQMEILKNKANTASAEVKVDIQKRIDELQNKTEEVKAKLSKIGDAAEGAWEALKNELDKVGESLQTAIRDTMEKFK